MYNGIKQNGNLYRAFYSFGGNIKSETAITIYAKDYKGLPDIDCLQIKNNTETQTDYFEKDRATVDIDNPFYKEILGASIISEAKNLERYKNKNAKCMTEYVKNTIWNMQCSISKMQNLYNNL